MNFVALAAFAAFLQNGQKYLIVLALILAVHVPEIHCDYGGTCPYADRS